MSIWRLVIREIAFRKLNFGLAMAAAAAAVACLVAVAVSLRVHDLGTDDIMRRHEDDIRKVMLDLGQNVLIYPRGQNLDPFADDFASRYMPETYAKDLVDAKVVTVNRLSPELQARVYWKEAQRTIFLFGTRGEVDNSGKKVLRERVPPGKVILGYDLAVGRTTGDKVKLTLSHRRPDGVDIDLQPLELIVHAFKPWEGNLDDVSIWIDLPAAQKLLDKPGLVNSLLALECHCVGDRLKNITTEIGKILPGVVVKEFHSKASARADARNKAAEKRDEMRRQQEASAALL